MRYDAFGGGSVVTEGSDGSGRTGGSPPGGSGQTKARLADVARRAGVGIATVDRVLNERGNVSPATARRVIEAARELSLPRILPVPYRRGLRLHVVMVRRDTPFFERLNAAFQRVAATLDRSVIVQEASSTRRGPGMSPSTSSPPTPKH